MNKIKMCEFYVIVLISLIFISFTVAEFDSVPSPDGTFHAIPRSSFSCKGRGSGYYADVETGCQIYHMCDGLGRQFSYACPNTTLFQQRMLICDHWYMVNCSKSEKNYDANLLIGQKDKPFVSEGEHDIRTPRPDIEDHAYASGYSSETFKRHYKIHDYAAVQNNIVGVDYRRKQIQTEKSNQFAKDPAQPQQSTSESTTIRNNDHQQYSMPGQWSINFIRNLAGITTPLPPQAPSDHTLAVARPVSSQAPPRSTPSETQTIASQSHIPNISQSSFNHEQKFNDRRNVKDEVNPGIVSEDPQRPGNFILNFGNTGLASSSTRRPSVQITIPQQPDQIPVSNNFNEIQKPSIFFEPPPFSPPAIVTPQQSNPTLKPESDANFSSSENFVSTERSFPSNNPSSFGSISSTSLPITQNSVIIQKPSVTELPPLLEIRIPSDSIEAPLQFPIYSTEHNIDDSTDAPLKIILSTQRITTPKPTPSPFRPAPTFQSTISSTTQNSEITPSEINAGLRFKITPNIISDSQSRILSRPNQINNNIPQFLLPSQRNPTSGLPIDPNQNRFAVDPNVKPSQDLLPPFEEIKIYDDATTVGPLVYYEWKWAAIPTLDLEPPKLDDPALEALQKHSHEIGGNQLSRSSTSRSLDVNSESINHLSSSGTTNGEFKSSKRPVVPTGSTELNDYNQLRKDFSIPDYQFPLESARPGQFEENETVDSFQIKVT